MSRGAVVVVKVARKGLSVKVTDMRAEPGDSWGEQHGRALGAGPICGPFV